MSDEIQEKNSAETQNEQEHEKKKGGLFSKLGQGIVDVAKKTGAVITETTKKTGSAIQEKIEDVKEKSAENKALRNAFETEANTFLIIYKDTSKKSKEILCIVDETQHILKTDFEITLPIDIDCIRDSRKQGYYSIFIRSERAKFTHSYNNKELSMDLFQITYTNEKPKQEVHQTYNIVDKRVDNSINAGKGAIVGDNNSVDKQTDINLGLNIPKL